MIIRADVHRLPLPEKSVDLCFCSPPYEAARTYGIGFSLKGQEWVDWAVAGFLECQRVTRGLVAWVIEGQTRAYRYSATPALFMADLHRRGVHLRKPPIFSRVGIPGSGGPDWLRNDYEFIVCAGPGGKLPWSDNTAMGKGCKYPVGGAISNRTPDGRRINQGVGVRLTDGRLRRYPHRKNDDGIRGEKRVGAPRYNGVDVANPGNIIKCVVGGGAMGHRAAHENEAPFPELLAEFFVRSFCPPDGTVLDPFSGSGTTAAVAQRFGRKFIASDLRLSQCELTRRRLESNQLALVTA